MHQFTCVEMSSFTSSSMFRKGFVRNTSAVAISCSGRLATSTLTLSVSTKYPRDSQNLFRSEHSSTPSIMMNISEKYLDTHLSEESTKSSLKIVFSVK